MNPWTQLISTPRRADANERRAASLRKSEWFEKRQMEKEQKLLDARDYILAHVRENGMTPSYCQVVGAMALSARDVRKVMRGLADEGLIRKRGTRWYVSKAS